MMEQDPSARPNDGRSQGPSALARALDAPRSLPGSILASLVGHVLVVAVLLGLSVWQPAPPPPRQVLLTRLVRLGPPRPKEQLPQLDASPKAAAARGPQTPKAPAKAKATPTAAPPAAAAAAAQAQAQAQAQSRAQARSALARLKREAAGATDGDVAGDTDLAQEGDRYLAEVSRCLHENFKIDGVDMGSLRGRRALLVLRIQADGRIVGHKITQSSGTVAVDQGIARAVRDCNKVSPPPARLQKELRQQGVEIEFIP